MASGAAAAAFWGSPPNRSSLAASCNPRDRSFPDRSRVFVSSSRPEPLARPGAGGRGRGKGGEIGVVREGSWERRKKRKRSRKERRKEEEGREEGEALVGTRVGKGGRRGRGLRRKGIGRKRGRKRKR